MLWCMNEQVEAQVKAPGPPWPVSCMTCGVAMGTTDAFLDACPTCGGSERVAHVFATDGGGSHEMARVKARRPGATGKRGVHYEVKAGDDYTRSTGTWSEVYRVIDRENDRYAERVTTSDGTIVRDVEESLSDHQGRGSARHRRAEE
jgi:hypothetical protein